MTNDSHAVDRFVLSVSGMTCGACAVRVEKALQRLPGVVSANVNFALERAEIESQSGSLDMQRIADAVMATGYQPVIASGPESSSSDSDRQQAELKSELLWLAASIALTAPLMVQMFAMFTTSDFRIAGWLEWLLATPVQFVIGARFYKAAWKALKARSGNMDVLVVTGTSAAYFYSVFLLLAEYFGWNTGHHEYYTVDELHLYFEASAVIITLVLLGKFMESRAKRGTTAAIRQLMELRPERARVKRDGLEIELPVNEVRRGDLVVVRPGERIPVDGRVVMGSSEIDESLITGESMPVNKLCDDQVTGGSINGAGLLEILATAVGEDSTLARIIRLVENAQSGKAPIQRMVDRISEIFVPIVACIALFTLLITLALTSDFSAALMASVSVLVIACPCALGLATPTAIVTGTGAGARAGILIKDIETLERAHFVDAVIFDKTGTLTEGKPKVVDMHIVRGDTAQLLNLVAAVQQGSEHPLARAMLACAEAAGVKPDKLHNFLSYTGLGVSGQVNECFVLIGSQRFMAEQAVAFDSSVDEVCSRWEAAGKSVVWVAANSNLLAIVAIADPLRATAVEAVQRLRKMGVYTLLISGDAQRVAQEIGLQAGVDEAHGGIRPDGKAAIVDKLHQQKRVVAMVGDGINDAPALASADVGIAMGSGTDIAMETAGITLMRPNPSLVADAIFLSRATSLKIKQNLFWALIYNCIAIPLAALGLLSPIIAGAAMALSSLSVVANSLLLRGWRAR